MKKSDNIQNIKEAIFKSDIDEAIILTNDKKGIVKIYIKGMSDLEALEFLLYIAPFTLIRINNELH